jgi:hypothetical protein
VLDDIFKLSPEELNVGLTKPLISSALGHASIHAKSMPIFTKPHADHKLCASPEISISGLIPGDQHDVGNFDHSYNSGVKITKVRGEKAVRLGAR